MSQPEGGTQVVLGPSAELEARLRMQSPIRPCGEHGAGGGFANNPVLARRGLRSVVEHGARLLMCWDWRQVTAVDN